MNGDAIATQVLSVACSVPLDWQATTTAPDAETATAVLRALATIQALAERPPPVNEEAVGTELEVMRLHQKTQLLIELLSVALSRLGQRPPSTEIRLSAAGCSWMSKSPAAVGSTGLLELWLHAAAPEPLRWPAQIIDHEPRSDGRVLVHARLLSLGEAAQSALDRHLFQLHRREIADAKSRQRRDVAGSVPHRAERDLFY